VVKVAMVVLKFVGSSYRALVVTEQIACQLAFAAENRDESKTGQRKVAFDSVVAFMTGARGRLKCFGVRRNECKLRRILLFRNFGSLSNQR
jgi:hypothetical protein